MQVSERQRRQLFEALETSLGPDPANTMMEILGPLTSDDPVARKSDISELRGEIKAMLPKLVAANVASMFGVSGLVIASAHFL